LLTEHATARRSRTQSGSTITTPNMNRITRTTLHVARTDWAPYIEAAVRALGVAVAAVYTAGYCTGQWLHNLNNGLSALLVRQPAPGPAPVIVQRQAADPHRAAIAAPRVHPAVALKAKGLSQRAIAAKLGCTRYEVRKALKG
jgi:hypothetical protein